MASQQLTDAIYALFGPQLGNQLLTSAGPYSKTLRYALDNWLGEREAYSLLNYGGTADKTLTSALYSVLGPQQAVELLTLRLSSNPAASLAAALVAQYKLDANFNDSSANAFNLTAVGGSVFSSDVNGGYVTGDQPTNSGDSTTGAGPSTFNALSGDFSISFSYLLDTSSNGSPICGVGRDSSTNYNFRLVCATGGFVLLLRKSGGGGVTYTSGSNPTATNLTYGHMVVAFSSSGTGSVLWYQNGVLVQTRAISAGTPRQSAGSANLSVALDSPGTLELGNNEKLYEVLLFNKAVSQVEATYLFNNRTII